MRLRWTETFVGIFIILAIAALLMLALQVSGLKHFFKTSACYKLEARFTNIGGLKEKAKVSIAGVTIGRVISIKLNDKNYEADVGIHIDCGHKTIPKDSIFSILTAGLLGDNFISINPGFSEEYLQDGDLINSENTESAVIVENLISKFFANKASETKSETQPETKTNNSDQSKEN